MVHQSPGVLRRLVRFLSLGPRQSSFGGTLRPVDRVEFVLKGNPLGKIVHHLAKQFHGVEDTTIPVTLKTHTWGFMRCFLRTSDHQVGPQFSLVFKNSDN